MKVNTHVHKDNEKKAKKLLKKRVWGKLINEWLRELEF